MVKQGRVQWLTDKNPSPKKTHQPQSLTQQSCLILWNSLDEWANLIYAYVDKNSLQGTVCTFYELTEAREVKNEKFYKIDPILFEKCLRVLEKQSKAEIFQLDE